MAFLGAFDVHRRQITFDYWDSDIGQVQRGRVIACREVFRSWLDRFARCGEVMFAVAGCTGWRCCAARSPRSLVASPAAGLCSSSTVSARSPRPRSGPSSATPAGFPPPARPSATLGWMSPSTHPTANAPLATSLGRDRRPCGGHYSRPANARPTPPARITTTTRGSKTAVVVTGPRCRWPVRSLDGPTTSCELLEIKHWRRCEVRTVCASAHSTDARGPLPQVPRHRVLRAARPQKNERPHPTSGSPHRSSCRRTRHHGGSRTEIRLGARTPLHTRCHHPVGWCLMT